ncbi:hypothetical protein [Mucilaginibacter lappiensis]|uniref:Uncharacterized protein n=1 Tax=Mucilaginibacter lappiensis TaxID=354630 RepID=A0A1N6UYH4_9SPHI|nr:hypothetical protein [Mucilaginibacter lappiensis]MBB6108987.1 hypothetical protein [Mucilaginibacter lappiensis]MBB6127416.1 hypothetical protein [Mucilaginibacter lappiensis]SIQ70680.1 hypothetical protein SAMN05421821_103224 [Mucilaginibacter lappiensis]
MSASQNIKVAVDAVVFGYTSKRKPTVPQMLTEGNISDEHHELFDFIINKYLKH